IHTYSNLRWIGQGMQLYANENKGKYPPNLAMVAEREAVPLDVFGDPRSVTLPPRGETTPLETVAWVADRSDFIYLGAGKTVTTPATAVLAYENPNRVNGDIAILWGDGHVSSITRSSAAQLIGFPDAPPSDPPPAPFVTPAPDA